jgi:hypothetical protein
VFASLPKQSVPLHGPAPVLVGMAALVVVEVEEDLVMVVAPLQRSGVSRQKRRLCLASVNQCTHPGFSIQLLLRLQNRLRRRRCATMKGACVPLPSLPT